MTFQNDPYIVLYQDELYTWVTMYDSREGVNYLNTIYQELPPGDVIRFLPDVDFGFDSFAWQDPVWGYTKIDDSWGGKNCEPDDPHYPTLFKELLLHPAIKRMIGVEQLTLPDQYATIPNAARFSRWEHITGSALLVKQLVEKWNIENEGDQVSGRQLTIYMLRTILSDIGHTFGSHMGDWMMGDADEKEHDVQLLGYIRDTGIADLLEKYNISPKEVILTEVEEKDFVECPSPNLCIDRVDYAVREIHRMNRFFDDPIRRFGIDDFQLVKDKNGALQLAMTDPHRALLFAKAYELLPKEDWSEPLQRLQTTLYTSLAKLVLTEIAEGHVSTLMHQTEVQPYDAEQHDSPWLYEPERHPRDVMMYAEGIIGDTIARISQRSAWQKQLSGSEVPSSAAFRVIEDIDFVMRSIARFAQSYYVHTRQHEVATFTKSLDDSNSAPTDHVNQRSILTGHNRITVSSSESLLVSFDDTADEPNSTTYKILLPQRKKRGIDPLILHNTVPTPLSRITDSKYTMDQEAYPETTVTITASAAIIHSLRSADAFADKKWHGLLDRSRLPAWQLQYMQKFVLTGLIAKTDYAKFTRRGALIALAHEEEIASFGRLK